MANPIVANLKALLMTEETATAPTSGTPAQIVGSCTDNATIESSDLTSSDNFDYVWHVFEALDGDVKGQKVLCTAYDGSQTATVTPFTKGSAPTATIFRHWSYPWPMATVTDTDGTTTTLDCSLRTEANDYWNDYYMLFLAGANTDLKNITDFEGTTNDRFTFATATAPEQGDACMPVQPLQPDSVEVAMDFGVPIEREIITDSLDPEGIVLGAIDSATVTLNAEIRGLATSAGYAVAASAPSEMHVGLSTVFTETLDTGDNIVSYTTDAPVIGGPGSNFTQYSLALLNGEVCAVTDVAVNTLSTQSGHIVTTPVADDVIYAGANYKPKDSAWKSCSFLCWYGDNMLAALTGGMPEIAASVEGNGIAHYNCTYHCVGGFVSDYAKPHDDIYDTSTPVVGKGNVNRVVFAGTELVADVISASFNFLDAPLKKGASFGAYENNGGHIYTSRTGSCSLVVQMEDVEYISRYRRLDEVDLLVQLGTIPTACWACWAPRAQIIEAPQPSESDGLMQLTLNMRFLRPTTQGQPAYVLTHF